jgi:transposase InsO family protein
MRRNEIPGALNDPLAWPGVDPSALDADRRAIYQQREQAVIAYLLGTPLADIERNFLVDRRTLTRLIERCLTAHADGRIFGLRALIPHTRAKDYQRIAPALRRTEPGGLTGAMGQLFDRLPQLARIVEREISAGLLGLSQSGRLFGLRDVQSKLLAACREGGLTTIDYPFNQNEMGYRSLAVWMRKRLEMRMPIRPAPRTDDAWNASSHPFSVIELDGHKLDLRIRVRYTDASGVSIDLESERLFVITLIDVCTRVVIGWHLVPAPQYDHHDVLAALQDALTPRHRRQEFLIPGMRYLPGAGFVADVLPELAYACWDVLKLDNAASHLTEDAFEPICRFVGCRMKAGPVGEPTGRPFIERFFGTLTDRMSRKVQGTTGRSPKDTVAEKGRAVAVPLLITLPELEELLDVSIANYHASAHDGLNGRSPLEALQLAVEHQRRPVRTLAKNLRARLHQLQSVHLSTVRGSVARGVPPYISLYGARYSNEVLQRTQDLVGKKIRVYIHPGDMRDAWAYLSNGADLGKLAVLEGWRYSRHTLRLRKHILRERRVGKLKFAGEQDPVQILAQAQRRASRRGLKQGTVALQLGQVDALVSGSEQMDERRSSQAPPATSTVTPVDLGDLKMQNR